MSTDIKINDLSRHALAVQDIVGPIVEKVVREGWYILGPECVSFEKDYATYCGVHHCVGVANGTDALELSFRALGIGEGSRVATVANAGLYTTTALFAVGALPVYIDIDEKSHLMDVSHLKTLVSSNVIDAIVITHLYGRLSDMLLVQEIANTAAIPIIEDCAQAHGAMRDGYMAGSIGNVGSFSFYPTKNLGGIGDGGAITTNDAEIDARLRCLRQYGWESKYRAVMKGGRNSRLDELQAAVLRKKLPRLAEWNKKRLSIATRYFNKISNPHVNCPPVPKQGYVAHLFVIECDDPTSLHNFLGKFGIMSEVHYPIPDYLQPSVKDLSFWPSLPVTERLCKRILTLPCYPELSNSEVDLVIECVNKWRP